MDEQDDDPPFVADRADLSDDELEQELTFVAGNEHRDEVHRALLAEQARRRLGAAE